MTHEDFIKLVAEAAGNAQGLRPLARHVRALYDAIRSLQEDDNSFAYIAEIIQEARADKTEPLEFMTRVKTYHHRDRKAAGDALIDRGMVRRAPASTETRASARSPVTSPSRTVGVPGSKTAPGPRPDLHLASEEAAMAAGVEDTASVTPEEGRAAAGGDMRALTAALHNRPGRRRLSSGG